MVRGHMKKVFPLSHPGKVAARVVDSVKHDIRKYVQRERRKALPEGFTQWTFLCRAGADRETAAPCELDGIGRIIDGVANAGGNEVYVEIVAQPGHRIGAAT
jgi:hypothetical protein